MQEPMPEDLRAKLTAAVQCGVDQWYVDNMHNSVVSRDTAVHNYIHAAKPALVAAIVDAIEAAPEGSAEDESATQNDEESNNG